MLFFFLFFIFLYFHKEIKVACTQNSTSVVLNRCATEPLSAAESSRGAANFWIWQLITSKLYLRVPPNCSITKEGCRESNKVEKHCSTWYEFFLQEPKQQMVGVSPIIWNKLFGEKQSKPLGWAKYGSWAKSGPHMHFFLK